jgi:hypothetical protein
MEMKGALTRCERSGRYRRPRLFVMNLRYFRRLVRKVVWKSSAETSARFSEEAFHYFGGCLQSCFFDNAKKVVVYSVEFSVDRDIPQTALDGCLERKNSFAQTCETIEYYKSTFNDVRHIEMIEAPYATYLASPEEKYAWKFDNLCGTSIFFSQD